MFYKLVFDRGDSSIECFNRGTQLKLACNIIMLCPDSFYTTAKI